jgi:hypothetical protein
MLSPYLARFPRGMAVVAMLYGCDNGPDAEPPPPLPPAQDAAVPLDTGVAAIPDGAAIFPVSSADAAPAMSADAGPAMSDAGPGGILLGGVDASAPKPDAGPIIINIPTRSVTCGGSECTTTSNRTCCQAWSRGTGFEGSPTCTTQAACEAEHSPFEGETNRAVLSEGDEPADCGGGQVCCFVRYGRPVTVDLFSSEAIGPGASRLCMSLENCNAGMFSFSGVLGVPVGLVACKTAADCAGSGSCMPESAGGLTTGMGGSSRPGVMVCR